MKINIQNLIIFLLLQSWWFTIWNTVWRDDQFEVILLSVGVGFAMMDYATKIFHKMGQNK